VDDDQSQGGQILDERVPSYYERALENFFARRWHEQIASMVTRLMPRGHESIRHLDIGCGDGVTIRMIKPEGEVMGVDLDGEMLRHAKARGINAIKADAQDLSMFEDNAFDLVTLLDTLEHIEHPTIALSEAFRVLKRRGFLIVTTPNASLMFRIIWYLWTRLGMGTYWETCPHVRTYSLWKPTHSGTSLVDLLRDVGFKPERTMLTNWNMSAGVRAVKL